MAFTPHYPSAGYRGILKLSTDAWSITDVGDTNYISLPYTRASISEKPRLITPSTAGFAGQIGVTEGILERTGDITLPIFSVSHLNTMLAYFLSEAGRSTFRSIILDNTFNKVKYQGFLTSIKLSCNPGEAVTATLGIMGGIVDESGDVDSTNIISYAESANSDHASWTPDATFVDQFVNTGTDIVSQIPFFQTRTWAIGGTGATAYNSDYWKDITGWDLEINNNTQTNTVTAADSADPQGQKLHQGLQTGTLSITLLNPYVNTSTWRYKPDWNSMAIGFRNTGTTSVDPFTTIELLKLVPSAYGPELPEPNTRMTQKVDFAIVAGENSEGLVSSTTTGILFQMGSRYSS